MKEIKELDDKYLVLKWDDINKLSWVKKDNLKGVLTAIDKNRKLKEKKDNQYVVLNLDDEIDIIEIRKLLYNKDSMYENHVRDIAVDLVNAILKAKEKP